MARKKEIVEAAVRIIRRATRKKDSAEEKVRIVLEGLRGEASIAALCRREGPPLTSTAAGARNSSRRGSRGWSATRSGRQTAGRSATCGLNWSR